jgi:predicted nucleic acid-binding protein
MAALRRYWDSCNFISLVAEDEPTRAETCQRILEDAEAGDSEIVISSLTIAEVIKPKGYETIPEEIDQKIANFFLHRYILVHDLTRIVAEKARTYARQYGMKPNDAVHLATAVLAQVNVLETWNLKDFKNAKDAGILNIQEPTWTGNLSLKFEE